MVFGFTAIPYRASTGSEQGFPCVVFPYRENPVFIAGFPVDGDRFFPVGNTTQENPVFITCMGLQCSQLNDFKDTVESRFKKA